MSGCLTVRVSNCLESNCPVSNCPVSNCPGSGEATAFRQSYADCRLPGSRLPRWPGSIYTGVAYYICKPHETLSRPRCAPSLYRVQRRILYLGVGAQKIYWSCCWVQNKLYFWTNVYRFYILFFVFHPILQRCNLCLSIQLLLLMIAEFKGPFKY